jgi:WD40 repeat protein
MPEVIKILRIEDKITEVGYGPYDNGYFIVGMEGGQILVFDVLNLDRIQHLQLFTSSVTSITFEPTNLIIIGSASGEVAAVTIIQKEMHYVYIDMGKKQYCTVALPQG